MYPDLSYFLNDLFHNEPDGGVFSYIKTYGFMQLLSFVLFYYFTYYYVVKEDYRFHKLLSKKAIFYVHLFLFSIIILMLNISLILSITLIFILAFIAKKIESPNDVFAIYFYFLVSLLIVGYIGSSVQVSLEYIYDNRVLPNMLPSGHGFFGGAIFIVCFLLILSINKGKIYIDYLGKSAPFVFLSYSIGKFGCHLSGDGDWGKINLNNYQLEVFNWILKSKYSHNVINSGCIINDCSYKHCYELCESVYPLPLLESIYSLCLFILMKMGLIKKNISTLLIFIGIMRFFSGFLREEELSKLLFGLSYSQSVSLILIGLGIWLLKNKK